MYFFFEWQFFFVFILKIVYTFPTLVGLVFRLNITVVGTDTGAVCFRYLLQSAMSGLSVSSEGNRASSSTICYQLPCKDSCKRDAWLRKLDDAFGPIENNMVVPYTDNLIQTGSVTTTRHTPFLASFWIT